jgi:hypothetical protein
VGREWERVEKGEVSLRVTETEVDGSCHSKEGFQVSKGDKERDKRGNEEARGLRHIYIVTCICVYNAVVGCR